MSREPEVSDQGPTSDVSPYPKVAFRFVEDRADIAHGRQLAADRDRRRRALDLPRVATVAARVELTRGRLLLAAPVPRVAGRTRARLCRARLADAGDDGRRGATALAEAAEPAARDHHHGA